MSDRTDSPTEPVYLHASQLDALVDRLRELGYRVIGPRATDGAIVFDEIASSAELPHGLIDEQDGGRYRLHSSDSAGWFDYVVGPQSVKQFLFPPVETIQEFRRDGASGDWQVNNSPPTAGPTAILGVRSCDVQAVAVQDRVFLHGDYVDPAYKARREQLLLIAVQCRRAAATCFCHSMNTGPRATAGFDLALTELDDVFVIEVGSERGAAVIAGLDACQSCSAELLDQAREQSRGLEQQMHKRASAPGPHETSKTGGETNADEPRPRSMPTDGIHDLLLGNLDHPRWNQVAERCLACANCTLVCPTCFCSSVTEVAELTGDSVRRERSWASCFMGEHSAMSSGVVRQSTAARYRQWLTHKLASWIDQYEVSGCVGCGRCITWCPVGIDLTEEVAAIRETQK